MYLNTGVKNSREHPMMIPVISPDRPVLASLSLFTADLEKEPKFCIQGIHRFVKFRLLTYKMNCKTIIVNDFYHLKITYL